MHQKHHASTIIISCILFLITTGCQKTSPSIHPSERGSIVGRTHSPGQEHLDQDLTQTAPGLEQTLPVQSENIETSAPMKNTLTIKEPFADDHESGIEGLLAECTIYRVEPGDSVSKIGKKFKIGEGFITRYNHIANPNLIRIGQKLKVIEGPFHVLIKKEDKTLHLYLNDTHVKSYDVAVGKNDSTPEGKFSVREKLIKPVWTDPYNRTQVKPDDPAYPLGTRWIEFAENGYGIHGTNDPDSIKKEASFGCIRMLDADVEELYDFLIVGSSVDIFAKSSGSEQQ
ncbi:MAG: L,D-transpeptidase family protein [Chlamydiota bacterium]|nr:L,D-transpeptidase family protein [Chlamydiota bacterium]